MKIRNVKKIAVLRSNSIGDYMFSLPALEALAAAYPDARITLLGKPWHAEFLAGRPGPVHRVVVLPPVKGVCQIPGKKEDPAATARFLEAMRREHFDICCQLYGGGRYSNPFIGKLGGRFSVGMKAADADASCLDRWVPYFYYFPEVQRYLEVVRLVGAEPVTTAPRLEPVARDAAEASRIVPPRAGGFAVLHPGATDTRRRWPAERFAEVARAIADKNLPVYLTGSGDEEALCAETARREPRAVNLFGKLSLGGLAGLLARASLVVANDTGPLHLARAAGARTVAIYWIGNYINAGLPDMERHRAHISWRLDCPVCGTSCIDSSCRHRASFVADIPSEPVARSCLELLGSSQRL